MDGLFLNHKGLQTAEGYILARVHLYAQVYYHKTTRGAESMLAALLGRVANHVKGDRVVESGLGDEHLLVKYFRSGQADPSAYFALDDAVVWASFSDMAAAPDKTIARLARGLYDRQLYKCFDVGVQAKRAGGDSLQRYRKKLGERVAELGLDDGTTLLNDTATLTAYGAHTFDEPGALQKVLIGEKDRPDNKDDINSRSPIVDAIKEDKLYRIYVPDGDSIRKLEQLWEETNP